MTEVNFKNQLNMADVSDEYREFVEKFKPKKTTDDCYTPQNIFDAIQDWACEKYGIKPEQIVRPFYPGGDYQREYYPPDCVVLDNPPFSILTQIVRDYTEAGIKFFLFAPALTCLNAVRYCCAILSNSSITYENGADVKTCFLTNLDEENAIITAPDLHGKIKIINNKNKRMLKQILPRYEFPENVITSAMAQKYSARGIDLMIPKKEVFFVRTLDSQREEKKTIYGGGYIVSDRCVKLIKKADYDFEHNTFVEEEKEQQSHVWKLSEKEKKIIDELNKKGGENGSAENNSRD